jgi:hypothetical protein
MSHAYVYEDVDTPGVFGLEAQVADSAALDAHLQSPAFGALLGAINVLAETASVSVSQPAREFGLDALGGIRRLRSQPPAPRKNMNKGISK